MILISVQTERYEELTKHRKSINLTVWGPHSGEYSFKSFIYAKYVLILNFQIRSFPHVD